MARKGHGSGTGSAKLRVNEVWVDCAYAREVWDKLEAGGPQRRKLRDDVGAGPDARIRGGVQKDAYFNPLEWNARKWAEIAGADPLKLILSGPPPIDPTEPNVSREADDYLRACAVRIAEALGRSQPLAHHLCRLTGAATKAELAECAADLTQLLMDSPHDALDRLWQARQHFETPPRVDRQALASIRAIVREVALLMYNPEEIEGVQEVLRAGGAGAVTVPAASATAAEIVMARLDRRPAVFDKAAENEWPSGKVVIPLPPETGRNFLAAFGPAIDRHIYSLTLSTTERALKKEELKHRLACVALGRRNPALVGHLYCLLNLEIAPSDRPAWTAHVAKMATRWPEVRFLDLKTDDEERFVLEKTLLWALKDFLFDE